MDSTHWLGAYHTAFYHGETVKNKYAPDLMHSFMPASTWTASIVFYIMIEHCRILEL
jgi:hypothetical protein